MGGFGIGGGASAALGSVANLFSSKMLMKYQFRLNRKMRRVAYQDTMRDMELAGLNPILAYQRGPTGAGSVGLAASPNFGGAMAQGAQAGAAVSQARTQKGLRAKQTQVLDMQRFMYNQQGEQAFTQARLNNMRWELLSTELPRAKMQQQFDVQNRTMVRFGRGAQLVSPATSAAGAAVRGLFGGRGAIRGMTGAP